MQATIKKMLAGAGAAACVVTSGLFADGASAYPAQGSAPKFTQQSAAHNYDVSAELEFRYWRLGKLDKKYKEKSLGNLVALSEDGDLIVKKDGKPSTPFGKFSPSFKVGLGANLGGGAHVGADYSFFSSSSSQSAKKTKTEFSPGAVKFIESVGKQEPLQPKAADKAAFISLSDKYRLHQMNVTFGYAFAVTPSFTATPKLGVRGMFDSRTLEAKISQDAEGKDKDKLYYITKAEDKRRAFGPCLGLDLAGDVSGNFGLYAKAGVALMRVSPKTSLKQSKATVDTNGVVTKAATLKGVSAGKEKVSSYWTPVIDYGVGVTYNVVGDADLHFSLNLGVEGQYASSWFRTFDENGKKQASSALSLWGPKVSACLRF